MMRSTEDLLADIDATLDQLICNASVLQEVSLEDLCDHEISAFQKTQESLVARFVHREELMHEQSLDRKNISDKIEVFGRLNTSLIKAMKQRYVQKPRVHRNRKKAMVET